MAMTWLSFSVSSVTAAAGTKVGQQASQWCVGFYAWIVSCFERCLRVRAAAVASWTAGFDLLWLIHAAVGTWQGQRARLPSILDTPGLLKALLQLCALL